MGIMRARRDRWRGRRARALFAFALATAAMAAAATPLDAAPGAKADLSVAMADAPDPSVVGGDLTYTITVHNAGPAGATNASVTDTLPNTATFRSASATQGTCANSGGVVTCNLGSLAANRSETVQVVVRPGSAGTISNTAKVTGREKDPTPSNNSATTSTAVSAPGADLSVTNTASSDRATTGQQLSYFNVVTNGGPLDATDVTITNTLSQSATVSEVDGHGGSCSVGPQPRSVTCSFASIPAGESRTMDFTVKLQTTGTWTSTATVSGSTADPDTANNSATAVTVVTEGADLETAVQEGHQDPYVWADDLADGAEAGLTYVVSVRNKSASVTSTDVLLSLGWNGIRNVTFQPQGVCDEWGQCVLDDIPPTGTVTVVVSARACQGAGLLSYLFAGALSFGTGDPVSTNDSEMENTTVVGAPPC